MKQASIQQKAGRIIMLLAMTLSSLAVSAVPAKPGLTRQATLADGTKISVRLVGDEFGHFWLAEDGRAFRPDAGGIFQPIDRQLTIDRAQLRRQQSNDRRSMRLAPGKNRVKGVGSFGDYTGKKRGVIILANFNDVQFKHSNDLFKRIANEKGFHEGDFKGSVFDYFYAQSEGKFDLEFDVVGPVTVSRDQAYYGANDGAGNDNHPTQMVCEAVKLADQYVNYADYDWDGDGEVDQVFVVYAGKGEADGGSTDCIWPHEYSLSMAGNFGDGEGALKLDGVTVDTYACGGELDGSTGKVGGIGTICHEFSHCLGYPDFYDTNYSGGRGMGYWDLMDSGSYNGNGYQPAGYTSYERWMAGWREPIVLDSDREVTGMKSLQDGGDFYIIYNDGNTNEYYLLENRQFVKWDYSLPGQGLLILHVDYSKSSWERNTPNSNPDHQRMTWVAADNKYEYFVYKGQTYFTFDGMATDPFPYGNVNAFGKQTTPAATFFNKTKAGTNDMEGVVKHITQNQDGTISFVYKTKTIDAPTFSHKSGSYAETQYVSISTTTEGGVIHYTTDGTTPDRNSTIYTEPVEIAETTTLKAIVCTADDESLVRTATYQIIKGASEDTKTFKLVTSAYDLAAGQRYIIGNTGQKVAAGALNKTYLDKVSVTVNGDVIPINDNVEVFPLEGSGNEFALLNKDGKYLTCTEEKVLTYSDEAYIWIMKVNVQGVVPTTEENGIIFYNSSSPRFTTYTTGPSRTLLWAYLFQAFDDTSAINEVTTTDEAKGEAVYTLSGIRVDNDRLAKGIYIRGGKKYIVK